MDDGESGGSGNTNGRGISDGNFEIPIVNVKIQNTNGKVQITKYFLVPHDIHNGNGDGIC